MNKILVACAFALYAFMSNATTSVTNLRVCGLNNPLGLDVTPTFAWQTISDERGYRQNAYQIVVRDANGTEMWNSGRVESAKQNDIKYEGTPLDSRSAYDWDLTVWGESDFQQASAHFETAFLTADEWQGKWIAPVTNNSSRIPYLGTVFTVPVGKTVERARLYASALGIFTIEIDGRKVTDAVLEPGETQYDKTVLYSTYDVTPLLHEGPNRIVAQVDGGIYHVTTAPGRYTKPEIHNSGTPSLLAELHVEYTDGSCDTLLTDKNWRTALSPTLVSNWWAGEDYDATLLFDTRDMSSWANAREVSPQPIYP